MNDFPFGRRDSLGIIRAVGLCCLALFGCSEVKSQGTPSGDLRGSSVPQTSHASIEHEPIDGTPAEEPAESSAVEGIPGASLSERGTNSGESSPAETVAASGSPPAAAKHREFVVEGTENALRVSFDDLDLLKVMRMDPVTPDCVDKMPAWLRGLDGKTVRIRGFMKPGLILQGIPQFMFVRDTGLCCFGPKGKIYDMIAVTLKEGTTTDYIELRPIDVVGKFRIELLQLEDDGTIFGLYYIDDARIVQK